MNIDKLNLLNTLKLFIIIPIFNEGPKIKQVIDQIPNYIDEIIIIDDGSIDNSKEVVNTLIKQSNKSKLTLLSHDINKGKGAAIKTGLNWLSKNFKIQNDQYVIFIDGDGQMDTNYINDLLNPLLTKKLYFSKGTRMKIKSYRNSMPRFRYFGNSLLKILNWISTGQWDISDPQNGYFAAGLEKLLLLNLNKLHDDYFFENSLLCEINILGELISEISIPGVYADEVSSINYFKFIPITSFKLLKSWFYRIYQTKNRNHFYFLSFLMQFIGFLFLILSILVIDNQQFVYLFILIAILQILFSIFIDYIGFKKSQDTII